MTNGLLIHGGNDMRKFLPATILLIALAAMLAWPAAAAEPEGEAPEGATVEPPGKEIVIKKVSPAPGMGPHVGKVHGDLEGLEPGPGKTIIREEVMLPIFGMLVPITFFAGIAAVIIVAIVMAHRATRMRYEVIQLALKEGKDLPLDLLRNGHRRRHDPLLSGLILTALGVALSIALGAVAGWVHAVWGFIPLLVGVAFLVYVPHWRKQKKEGETRP
jgi:hypothetical protein